MPHVTNAELNEIIGLLARAARLRAGLRQSDVLDRTGIKPGLLSQIENGKVTATVAKIVDLARAYGVTPGDFFPPGQMSNTEALKYAQMMVALAERRT